MGGTTKTAHWLVIAENTKSDTFLLQEHRTQTALFLASVRRQADLLETRLRENALAIATQKKLDMLNNPEIVDVVPFALGLGHDLGHLVGRLNRELHLLTHLDLPATAALQLKGINGVAKSLSHIKGSLASFAALKTPKFEQTRIGEVLDRTLEYAVDLTRRPGITIQAHYRASQVITLRGDSGLLAQLFFNLIDNATKELMFVRYRVPTLAISSRCSPDGFAEVDFRDNGYGIDDADLPRIFERYFSRTGGTGLGLYYSKVIAKVHGGDITLNTKSGDGSTFTVRLPI
jgi:signal transduction histidine kinase